MEFLAAVLNRMGWGDQGWAWVRLIYGKQQAGILVQGRNSRWIRVLRGVRHGCPLSPLLFNIIIEILAIVIQTSPEIKGVQIFSTEHKAALCTNDAGLLLLF